MLLETAQLASFCCGKRFFRKLSRTKPSFRHALSRNPAVHPAERRLGQMARNLFHGTIRITDAGGGKLETEFTLVLDYKPDIQHGSESRGKDSGEAELFLFDYPV